MRLEVIPGKGKTDQRRVVPIRRNEVKLEEQAAQKEVIEFTDEANQVHRIGVIDIPAFYLDFEAYRNGNKNYRSTTRDVQRLIDELVAEGVEGLVIDLRDNGGGSLKRPTSSQGCSSNTARRCRFGPRRAGSGATESVASPTTMTDLSQS